MKTPNLPLPLKALSAASLCALSLLACDAEGVSGDSSEGARAGERAGGAASVGGSSKADAWREATEAYLYEDIAVAQLKIAALEGREPEALARLSAELESSFSAPELIFDGSLSADSKRGLTGTLSAKSLVMRGEAGVVREERYEAKGALSGRAHLLPFNLKSGAKISYLRLFESEAEALEAPLMSPLDLPFDLERALALPEGCVVSIPVEASLSLNITGQLLSQSWGRAGQLSKLLSASSAGFLSGSLQGMMLVEGDLQLTITRLQGSQIRVRVSQASELSAEASASLNLGAHAQVKVFPSAGVERAISMKDRLARWGRRPSELLRSTQERLDELKRGLPAALSALTQLAGATQLPSWLQGALDAAQATEDPALELLKRGSGAVEGAADWLHEEVEARLDPLDAQLSGSLNWLKRHSERAFNLNASLTLSREESRQLGLMGDYLLDLSRPHGAAAFEAILSGRAQWRSEAGALDSGLALIDLSAVDLLSEEGADGVRRLERASMSGRSSAAGLSISAPLSQWSFERERDLRVLDIERRGAVERWEAEVWRVDRGLQVGPVREREQLSLGVALPLESSAGAGWSQGALWLSWHKRWPSYEQRPVTRSFSEALNLSGRLGAELGLMSHFNAEAPGALSAELTFTLGGELLDALFYELSPLELWRASAAVAEGFNNEFGLPFLNAWSRPRLSPEEEQACDTIAYHWGSQYCWLVLEELIEPLLELRHTELLSNAERLRAQRAWLSGLSRSQLLLNPIGARVLARLLAELAHELGLHDSASLSLKLHHPTHSESSLAERFESPSLSERPRAAFEVARWLGVGEGLSLED